MTWTRPEYEAITGLLAGRTGLSFPPERRPGVELGIRRTMERAGRTDLAGYLEYIGADARALDDLVVELTIGETYFFRDPAQFQFIRRELLPDLRRRRGDGHVVRAWSAGCASGEEAYSLAILFGEEGWADHCHILATDISRAALAKARAAHYGDWSLRGDSAAAVRPYLQRHDRHYVLPDSVRRRVTLEYLNLAMDVYPSFGTDTWGMDLILCRNVFIYFAPETVQQVARRLYDSLSLGGWLLTGASDPPLSAAAPFETVVTDAGVFYRRGVRPGSDEAGLLTRWHERNAGPPVPEPGARASISPAVVEPPPQVKERPRRRTPDNGEVLQEARAAFAEGDYGRAAELVAGQDSNAQAAALRVRAVANLNAEAAEQACAEALSRHPLVAELHYLRTVLLLNLGQSGEAIRAVRRALYLDRSLAIAHFTLGSILSQRGDLAGARRAYRNAYALASRRPAAEELPLAEGETAGRLAEVAAAQLAILANSEEASA